MKFVQQAAGQAVSVISAVRVLVVVVDVSLLTLGRIFRLFHLFLVFSPQFAQLFAAVDELSFSFLSVMGGICVQLSF